jgi:hypothetical protein
MRGGALIEHLIVGAPFASECRACHAERRSIATRLTGHF